MPTGLGACSPFPDSTDDSACGSQLAFLTLSGSQMGSGKHAACERSSSTCEGGRGRSPAQGSEPPAADWLRKCSVPAWAQVRPATPSSGVTGPGKEWSVVVLCGGDARGGGRGSFVPLQDPGMMSHSLFPVFHTPHYLEVCLQLVPHQAQDCMAPFSQTPKLSRKVFLQAALLPRQAEPGALGKMRQGC